MVIFSFLPNKHMHYTLILHLFIIVLIYVYCLKNFCHTSVTSSVILHPMCFFLFCLVQSVFLWCVSLSVHASVSVSMCVYAYMFMCFVCVYMGLHTILLVSVPYNFPFIYLIITIFFLVHLKYVHVCLLCVCVGGAYELYYLYLSFYLPILSLVILLCSVVVVVVCVIVSSIFSLYYYECDLCNLSKYRVFSMH